MSSCQVPFCTSSHFAGVEQVVRQSTFSPHYHGIQMRFLVVATWLIVTTTARDAVSETVLQVGHSSSIKSVSVSPDGQQLLTGGQDGKAILWDLASGRVLRVFNGCTGAAAFSPTTKQALIATTYDTVELWDTENGTELTAIKQHLVDHISWTADGKSALANNHVWSPSSQAVKHQSSGYQPTAISPSGGYIATKGRIGDGPPNNDNQIVLWDATSTERKELKRLNGHLDRITFLHFSRDSKYLVSSSDDKTAILWDVETGRKLLTFSGHKKELVGVALSPDGARLVTLAVDSAAMWDSKSGKKVCELELKAGTPLKRATAATFTPSGTHVIIAARKSITVWDVKTGKLVQSFGKETPEWVNATAFDSDVLRVSTGNHVVSFNIGAAPPTVSIDRIASYAADVSVAEFSPRGSSVCFSASTSISLYDFAQKKLAWTTELQDYTTDSVSFSLSDKLVAVGSEDGTAVVFEAATGRKLRTFKGHEDEVLLVSLSPNGRQLLTASKDKSVMMLWDVASGTNLKQFTESETESLSWSADGSLALLSDVHTGVRIVNLTSGKEGQYNPEDVAVHKSWFSPNAKHVVVGTYTGKMHCIDATNVAILRTFTGHTDVVDSLRFSSDERLLLTGSRDGTTRLWDFASGQELCRLICLPRNGEWVVITPDGRFDCSTNGARLVMHRVGNTNEVVPLERYRKGFYQPGLLAEVMRGKQPDNVAAIQIDKSPPPTVQITYPDASARKLSTSKLEIQAVAESRGDQPVTAVRLMVDGRPYGGERAIRRPRDPQLGKVLVSWDVELTPGTHTIKVMAETRTTVGASDEFKVQFIGPGVHQIPQATLYVLAIGIAKAYPKDLQLDYAADDATALAKGFRDYSKSLFKDVKVTELTETKATRAAILEGLDRMRRAMTQHDVGVVFFAGHGERDADGSLYFLPSDVNPESLVSTAVDATAVKKTVNSMPGKVLLILDSCHAGGIINGKLRNPQNLNDELVRDLSAEESGVIVMCSTTGSGSAQESHSHKHGIFTVAILEGIAGKADSSKDGIVNTSELDSHVTNRVKELSRGTQAPVTGKPGIPDFGISKP